MDRVERCLISKIEICNSKNFYLYRLTSKTTKTGLLVILTDVWLVVPSVKRKLLHNLLFKKIGPIIKNVFWSVFENLFLLSF